MCLTVSPDSSLLSQRSLPSQRLSSPMAISAALSPSISAGNASKRIPQRSTTPLRSWKCRPLVLPLPGDARGHLPCAIADGLVLASTRSVSRSSTCLKALRSDSPEGDPMNSKVSLENIEKEVEYDKVEHKKEWKQLLESFQEQVLLIQRTSMEGMEYMSSAETCPHSLRDVMETLASLPHKLTDLPKLDDFDVGILYGILLSVGGFASFMFTGSISAIRFGIILGSALLTMAISSLRAQRQGKSSPHLLRGQLAIIAIIFLREWCLLFHEPSIMTFSTAVFRYSWRKQYLSVLLLQQLLSTLNVSWLTEKDRHEQWAVGV